MKLNGDEHEETLRAANNYASILNDLKRFDESRALLRKVMPVARRVIREANELMLRLRWNYAMALYKDTGATLDDHREAITTLEEIERIAQRVLGGAHPLTTGIETSLRNARAALARDTPSPSA